MNEKEKSHLWQYSLLGLMIVGIGKSVSVASSTIAVGVCTVGFIICIIKGRKKLNKIGLYGYFCMLAGMSLAWGIMSGFVIGIPLPVCGLSVFSLFGIGTVLIGWGAYLKNPEKVSKRKVYVVAVFWILILVYWGILFALRYHFY